MILAVTPEMHCLHKEKIHSQELCQFSQKLIHLELKGQFIQLYSANKTHFCFEKTCHLTIYPRL